MTLDFPTRARDVVDPERVRHVGPQPGRRQRSPTIWAHRHRRALIVGLFALFILGFSSAWTGGALVLDGPGISLYVRMMLDHLGADRLVPYWLPELWAGAPIWAVTPTLPLFLLLPLAAAVGPAVAVKLGILGMQLLGACGAYVLARTLWRHVPAAVVAGILFGLQPLIISHGALTGSQPTVAVMAAAPWLAWSLRKGLRGEGWRYVAGAGLLAGFAVLMQAEYAIGLAVMCACLLLVEAGRVGTGANDAGPIQLLGRAAAVVATGLGSIAYWLLPFGSLGKSFVLSPPELVQGELFEGSGAKVGRELGVFFGRMTGNLTGAVGFNRQGLLPLFFHLGWACLALTAVTVVALPRKDRDGTLSAILLSAALGVWLTTGVIPLASSGPAARTQWIPFVVAGLTVGILLGTLLRPLRLGWATPVCLVGAVSFLVAVPYLTPFVTLQKLVPLFESFRFPRFYTVAPLALALGAAYPVVLVHEWAERRRAAPGPTSPAPATLAPALASAAALAIVAVFLVDIWPYRSFYRIRPPASAAAYQQVVANLAAVPGKFRLAPTQIEPTATNSLLDTGRLLSVGWPHFVASKQVWRLTAEPFLTPLAYRQLAFGLSATGFVVTELTTGKGTAAESVPAVDLTVNPRALPMVRAYSHTVAMATRDVTPELAVGLAHRNVGVVTADPNISPALKATTVVDVRSTQPCADDSVGGLDPALASQLGVACGMHTWLSTLFAGVDLVNLGSGVGAVFRSTADRLQGISVYLDRVPDRTDLTLYEVVGGGGALGAELARGKAVGADEYGLSAFTFDPISGSAGKQYAFVLTCAGCPPERVPRLVVGHSVDQPGDLLVGTAVRLDRSAGFAPIYEPVSADPPVGTALEPSQPGPGKWRVRVSGAQPALVVVAEAWFPGWEARVDGHRAPVVEADGAFLGVPVDAGAHVVTLQYRRPPAAQTGRAITAGTFLALVVLARRRRRTAGARPRPGPQGFGAGPAPGPPRPVPVEAILLPGPGPGPGPGSGPESETAPEPDWDDVFRPRTPEPPIGPAVWPRPRRRRDEGDVGDVGDEPETDPPRRPPGTARWPPEPR